MSPRVFPIATDPRFVPAAEAGFMRPDDWVIGICVGNGARCYPAFMLDNHHAVNDSVCGRHIAVMHCEICCSNAVFEADLEGRRLTFGTGGLYGATLAVIDEQTGSLWSHGMGVAFDGPLRGACLRRLPSFQASFEEWIRFFPDSEIMLWSAPETHPDPRHGHGTDATFAKPGIEELVLRTLTHALDPRLPEDEIVLTLFTPDGCAALPIQALYRAGGLFAADVAGRAIAVLAAGHASALCGAFETRLCGDPPASVDLALCRDRVVDRTTGSSFRADGLAVAGPLRGRRLLPVASMLSKWHSLACFLPDIPILGIAILAHAGDAAARRQGPLLAAIAALQGLGWKVSLTREHYALELPHGAQQGFRATIAAEAFEILLFADAETAADDLLARSHAVRSGRLLIASAPERFADAANSRPLDGAEIAWSALPEDADFRAATRQAARAAGIASETPSPLGALIERLRVKGFAVGVRHACFRDTLPVRARYGLHVDIAGDPFVLYRFDSHAAALDHGPAPAHSLVTDCFVLRSDPPDVYRDSERATLRRDDSAITWSPLLQSRLFAAALRDGARG